MNFILLNENYSIFPLSNRKIEVKVYDSRKVDGDILKNDMKEILFNLKNGNYFSDHTNNLKKGNMLEVPDYKIFTNDELNICEEFFNVLYEDNKNLRHNYISTFIILISNRFFIAWSSIRFIRCSSVIFFIHSFFGN